MHRANNYPNLLPAIPRYCCPVKIFHFVFYSYKDMNEI